MILWRYESVMGLLGWEKSDFSECTRLPRRDWRMRGGSHFTRW